MADRTGALRAAVTQAERFLDTLDERRVGAAADASAIRQPRARERERDKVVSGRSGATLVSFNEHAYLEGPGRALVTYR